MHQTVPYDKMGTEIGQLIPIVSSFLQKKGVQPICAPITLYHGHNKEAGEFDVQVRNCSFFNPKPHVFCAYSRSLKHSL